jgi:hypothetical protein
MLCPFVFYESTASAAKLASLGFPIASLCPLAFILLPLAFDLPLTGLCLL